MRCAARVAAAVPILAVLLLASPPPVAAAAAPPSPSPAPTPDYSAEAWWIPAGLRGQRLTAVHVDGGVIDVTTADGAALASSDGGRTFARAAASPNAGADVRSGDEEWAIRDGAVLHGHAGDPLGRDPGSPDLGRGAHLLAAPAAAPGVVVAVSDAGIVWRRTQDGQWGRALVLLPSSLVSGIPTITDLTAFTAAPPGGGTPVSVYMATDGYSVLATQNGGDDWFRDSPGLPDHVLGLATSPQLSAVLAATDDGLWVHHLRPLPGVPQYAAPDLAARQVWIALLGIGACLGGVAALWLLLGWGPPSRGRVRG